MEENGFTFIETIIVITTFSIISLFSFRFFSQASYTYSLMRDQNKLYQEATIAMERMSREIRDANSITEVTSGKIKIKKTHGTALDSNLYVTFILDNGSLKRGSNTTATDPSAYEVLASNIKANGFTVSNPVGDEVLLVLELELLNGSNIALQSKIYPKNIPFTIGLEYTGRDFNGDWQEVIQ